MLKQVFPSKSITLLKTLFFFSLFLNALFLYTWLSEHRAERLANAKSYIMERELYYANYPIRKGDFVFAGTSITEWFNIAENFSNVRNRGIAGETASSVRIRTLEMAVCKPKVIFVEMGINDLIKDVGAMNDIIHEFNLLADSMKLVSPETMVFLISILPVSHSDNDRMMNDVICKLNTNLSILAQKKGLVYIDTHKYFFDGKGMREDFSDDGFHPNGKGYSKLKELLTPYITDPGFAQ